MSRVKRTAMMMTNGKSHGHVTTGTKQPSNDAYIAVNADLQSGQKTSSDVRASAAETFGRLAQTDYKKGQTEVLE